MQIEKQSIYPNMESEYKRELERLAASTICEENKAIIHQFREYKISCGDCKKDRIVKLTYKLRKICEKLNVPLAKATQKEIQAFIANMNEHGLSKRQIIRPNGTMFYQELEWSPHTKVDYRRVLRQFYLWYKKIDSRIESHEPEERKKAKALYDYLDEIKTSVSLTNHDTRELITEENVQKVITDGCRTTQEKAFIAVLHETGARAAEFLTLKLENVEIKQNRAHIYVIGKTGQRKIPIRKSIPLLACWMEVHPHKSDPKSHLWLSQGSRHHDKPYTHIGGQKIINRAFQRAGLQNRRHNFHWFRHSSASILAAQLPEQLLDLYFGWVIGSRQSRRYCHLCPKQLEDAIDRIHGIKTEENILPSMITCGCKTVNPSHSKYCYNCGRALSIPVLLHDEVRFNEEMEKTIQVMMEVMRNPEMLKEFELYKKLHIK